MFPDRLCLLYRLSVHIGLVDGQCLDQIVSIVDIQRVRRRAWYVKYRVFQLAIFDLLAVDHAFLAFDLHLEPL